MRGRRLRLRGADRRPCRLKGGAVVVQLGNRSGASRRELLTARDPPLGGVKLGLSLRNERLGSSFLSFALCHLALRGLDADERPLQLCLGFPQLRLQDSRIHSRQFLPNSDKVTFVDQDVLYSARSLGRHVDLDRLDAAVPSRESVRQLVGLKKPPGGERSGARQSDEGDSPQPSPSPVAHVIVLSFSSAWCQAAARPITMSPVRCT